MAEASRTQTQDTQLFRGVFNASPIGIAVENFEGQPLFVNPAFCSMLGFSEEELRSKHCVQFSPPEDAEKDWVLFQQLRAGSIDHYQLEKRYFRRDGSLVWGRLSISLLNSHPDPLVLAMVEDITDKRAAEEAVRTSEERLRLAQQAARIGTFEWNIQTGANTWTPELEEMYGLPPSGFGGTQTAFENLVHPDDRAGVIELDNWALKTGNPTKGEWRVVWPDGSVHWIAGRWQVLMDESGEPLRMVGVNMDVTERKRAEETLLHMNRTLEGQTALLQSREELLRIFVKHVPSAVAMLDRDMRYLQVSDRWCTDYLRGRAQILGRSHYEIFPDMPERWKEVHRRGLQGETLRADEDHWDGQDGPHWARWEVRPWKTSEGTVGGILILAEDITRRKQMEEALRESEDKLRLLLDSTAEAIYGIDLEHRCTFCNPACLRTLGYQHVDEVLGKNTHHLLHHSRADGTVFPVEECRVHRVTQTGEGVHAEDEVFWRANGTSFPAEYWSYPQRRGEEVVGAVVAFSDITERKLAEEKLREYEKAVEGSEEMMAVVDREYRYLIANRKFLSQRNMTKEQVVGRLVPEVLNKGVFETVVKEKLDECFRGKVVRYEMRYTYPELGERDLFISNFPIEGSGGVDRVACILQDITERKRAEEALSCMNRRVIEAEERERNRIAKDLHEDIGQRLALLAIAVEQLKTDLPHQAVELLDRVDAVWKQSLEILTDVKASAHELYSPRLEYLGIAAVMRSFCGEFGQRKKVKIDFRNDSVPSLMQPEVGICLFRVLQEALHNGVKHSGVKKFEVRLWGASDGIHLTVRDSGAGFDTDTARKGRGLGLTRIEQRVRLVNGTFSVDSQPERGTTVYVSVPLRSGSDSLRAAG